jgi:hypothetical protein
MLRIASSLRAYSVLDDEVAAFSDVHPPRTWESAGAHSGSHLCYFAHPVLYRLQIAVIGARIDIQIIGNLLSRFLDRCCFNSNLSLFCGGIGPLEDLTITAPRTFVLKSGRAKLCFQGRQYQGMVQHCLEEGMGK